MNIRIDASRLRNPDESLRLEWLETNGLGGWSSSTLAGAHTRRYHGLLVASTRPPAARMVLLSKLDERLITAEGRFDLGCNRYPGAVHPRGFEHLVSFQRDFFPTFEFEAGPARLRKTVACLHGENTVVVLYELLKGSGDVTLELLPMIAFREIHSLARANAELRPEVERSAGTLRFHPYEGAPDLFLAAPGAEFRAEPTWYYRIEHAADQERGHDFQEDLFSHGVLSIELAAGQKLAVMASTADTTGRDALALLGREKRRREALLKTAAAEDDLSRALVLAADQFLVRRGESLATVVAGYPWFSDRGRDNLVALPGLCLATGRPDEARSILRTLARRERDGLLPHRFADDGVEPEYDAADVSLWLAVTVHRYLAATDDPSFVRDEMLPVLRRIVAAFEKGTRFGIREDGDGLVVLGEAPFPLTWMDAKHGDWTVTPRSGRPVEIQALWYNTLSIVADLEKRLGDAREGARLERKARKTKASFIRAFWNEAHGCLDDVVNGDDRDRSIRPNQVLALGLPYALLSGPKAKSLLEVVERLLLTPFGLRTLAPGDPSYRPRCEGDAASRDAAYHQGTVWSWLLGPYCTAVARIRGAGGRKQVRQVLEALAPHLSEAGLGSISETFDAEPPHTPRGCFARAWSVGELLRSIREDAASRSATGRATSTRRAAAKRGRATTPAKRGRTPRAEV